MIDSIKRISLDIHSPSSNETVNAKRGDTGRKICISLVDGGVPYIISEECYAVFTAKKPDGNVLYNHCTIENNTIIYQITEQSVAVEGRVNSEIKLYGADDKLITSAKFTILVYGTVYNAGDEIQSEKEVDALTHLVSEATSAISAANEAAANAAATADEIQTARENGAFDGKDGRTPVKGEDYFTEEDVTEIAKQAASLVGAVKTVNGVAPDENGNVAIEAGGLDLENLTMEVTEVDGGNQLSLSDGTTTKTALIPAVPADADDIQTAVDSYLAEHPVENGKDGADGKDGENGADGLTPHIGDNGNWWIGDTDTGVTAQGKNGADGKDGAAGKDGANGADGYTPVKGMDYFTEEDKQEIAELAAEHIETDTTLTGSGKAADAKAVGDSLNGKLSKSGGIMTGKIVFPTADQNVGFANSEDMKIFGYGTFNGAMHMKMGDTQYPFQIRGNGERPKYNDGVIALMGDIPDTYNKTEIDTIMGSYITDIDNLVGGDS